MDEKQITSAGTRAKSQAKLSGLDVIRILHDLDNGQEMIEEVERNAVLSATAQVRLTHDRDAFGPSLVELALGVVLSWFSA